MLINANGLHFYCKFTTFHMISAEIKESYSFISIYVNRFLKGCKIQSQFYGYFEFLPNAVKTGKKKPRKFKIIFLLSTTKTKLKKNKQYD